MLAKDACHSYGRLTAFAESWQIHFARSVSAAYMVTTDNQAVIPGTNTYLVGRHNPYILVDTGEGRPEYGPVLEKALRESPRSQDINTPLVSDIVITHRHHDHYDGLPTVLSLLKSLWDETTPSLAFKPPKLHKFPLPPDAPDEGLQAMIALLDRDLYVAAAADSPFHELSELQTLQSPDASLQITHTPGHTTDSICLFLREDKALLTADTVLGQGTAVFEDLGAYMSSLRKMLKFGQEVGSYVELYPGHGPVVKNGPTLIETYIKHRQEREDQIISVLESSTEGEVEGEPWRLWSIVQTIYKAYPQNLWAPAAHGIGLHLKKLQNEGKVRHVSGESIESKWELCRV